MIKWIFQDLKRTLKNHKTYILVIVILLSMVNYIATNYNKEPETITYTTMNEKFEMTQVQVDQSLENILNLEYFFEPQCVFNFDQETSADCSDYLAYKKVVDQLINDPSDEEFNHLKLFMFDKLTDDFLDYYENQEESVREKLDEYLLDTEFIKEYKVMIKETIASKYEDFDVPYVYTDTQSFNVMAIQLHETNINMMNNYPLDIKYQMTSSFFIANYLNDYFLLLVVAGILLVFDSFYRDYKSGVIKNILSAPIKRNRYVLVKTVSSVISLMVIIFIPLIICATVLYIIKGYDTPGYPIYTARTTLRSFFPEREFVRSMGESPSLVTSQSTYRDICSVEPVTKFAINRNQELSLYQVRCVSAIPGASIAMMPLSKYIMITLGYLLLVIIFIASLNTLVSLIASNQVINLISLLALVLGSNIITNIFFGQTFLKFLPFTFLSPTALMMQTIPYTMLNGTVTLSLWTLVITIVNRHLIKRKDFTY